MKTISRNWDLHSDVFSSKTLQQQQQNYSGAKTENGVERKEVTTYY
jgi:hypothetical protein